MAENNNSIRISDIKDAAMRELAQKYDVGGKKGVLEGQELVDFNKAKSKRPANTIVVGINDVKVLRTPHSVLNAKNIVTVFENYEKKHAGHTLLGDFIKDDEMSREERKKGALATFEILYNKVLSGAKTEAQKQQLKDLKAEFEKTVAYEMDERWFEWTVSASGINKLVNKILTMYTATSQELAGEIYNYADDNHFSFGDDEFKYLLDSITPGNAIQVSQKIKKHPANKGQESLLKILAQEYTTPFSDEEKAEKKKQITKFVTSYFTAAGYAQTPYMDEAKKLLNKILNSTDTGSNIFTSDIEKLDSLMDTLLIKKPEDIAKNLFKIINDNSYAFSRTDLKVLLDKVNESNVNEIINEFSKCKANKNHKSLLKMIDEEWGNDDVRKTYINKIVLAQLNASGLGKNKDIVEHVKASLKNEKVADTELLMISLGKNKDIKYMSKTLFNALSKDSGNLDKEYVRYFLNSINKNNVVKFLEEFNKLSNGVPITKYLQNKGDTTANEYILSITDSLLEANSKIFDNEDFSSTFGVLKSDVAKYIRKNISDKEDISWVVNSFLSATPQNIAKNIEAIASDKFGAADDIAFKLWVAKINNTNAREVIESYKKAYNGVTPINAIIEERNSKVETRQSQILHVLSALVNELGENKVNPGNIQEFNSSLEKELFGWGIASADKLNSLLETISAGIPANGENIEADTTLPTTIKNIRNNIPEISLGNKYGNFSWQYSNLKNIKTLKDVAKLTGLSMDYLEELKESEGVRPTVYKCSSKKLTIGIGHNFHNARGAEKNYLNKTTLTESEMCQILAYDLVKAINTLKNSRNIDTSQLKQGEFEALLDVAFNAPGYMTTLANKTNEALKLRASGSSDANNAFEDAAYQFNQQLSNAKIAAGLCKRRIKNVMRYMGVDKLNSLPKNSPAKNRIIILALNGYNASSFINKLKYRSDVSKILGITEEEFDKLKYPAGYKK